ncbi:peptide deformylase [Natranaerovirga hydrolytica]|uniref:Peptide deformylase n=1 Tax=Natranaerovirga hydrolytica TaxID=680378 RepID=A0A4R1MYG6_9FIRM|nr:peptide deformylase [Natranaerovirga hydrolytica]TCK98338.1 peptide deformylase [Natranaerovirga hydrolytica]
MAIRKIREEGDEILRKKSKTVDQMTDKIKILIEDMKETMYDVEGVGLAAPQVGVLRRIIIVDVGEGLTVLINPEIIEKKGEQIGVEGCLSVPGKIAETARPSYVKVKGLNELGEEVTVEGEDFMAKALCHEIDHLNGVLFIDNVIRFLDPSEEEEEE